MIASLLQTQRHQWCRFFPRVDDDGWRLDQSSDKAIRERRRWRSKRIISTEERRTPAMTCSLTRRLYAEPKGRSTFSPDMSLLSCDVPDTLSQMLSLFYFIFIIHLTLDVLNFFFLFYHIFHKVILSRKVIQNIENNLTQNLSNLKDWKWN